MPFSIVGAASDGANASSLTGTSWPAGVAAGDVFLLWWTMQNTSTPTTPTGCTQQALQVGDSGSMQVGFYTKILTGSESGTITLTGSVSNRQSAEWVVIRGAHASSPIDTWQVRDEASAVSSHACPGVTLGFADCGIVTAISERATTGTTGWTPPSGYTERADSTTLATGTGGTVGAIADDGLATSRSAGATVTPPNWTSTNAFASANVLVWTVSLRPGIKTVAVGQATETDAGNAVAWAPKNRLIGQAIETDQAFGLPHTVSVAGVTETDEAFGVTALLRPVVTWNVAIDWDNDGDFTDPGDEVTERALERTGFAMDYGRDQIRELSPMAAGAAELELGNDSKDYSPDNLDSPLYGKVRSGRPVQITASEGGTDHVLFNGFIDEFDVKPARGERSVGLTALDAVAKLRGAKATTQLYRGIRTGTAIGYVLDAIGWPADLRDLDPGATTPRWWWAEDEDAFEAIQKLVQSEGPPAMLTSDEQGRIVFRDRHHRLLGAGATQAQATFTDESAGEPSFMDLAYNHGWSEIVNSVSVKVDELDPAPNPETIWQNESNVNVAPNSTLTLRLTLDDPVINPTLSYTTLAGTVTASLTVDSGQTLTLTLTAGVSGVTLAGLQVLGQPVTAQRSFTVLLEDAASILDNGLRSLPYEAPWAGVNDAAAVAQLALDASAQRRPTVTITLRSSTALASTRLTEQLTRDLSDRIHIREPQTCVDHDFHIEHISHRALEAGLVLETTFGTERAIFQADNVFRFDDSDNGFDDGVFASVALTDPETLFLFDVAGQGFDDGVFAT